MIEQIIVTPKVGTINTTLLTAGKYCEKDIFVDLYPVVAHEQETALAVGYNQGKEEGKDAVWEAIQEGGTRTDYNKAFASLYWNETNFDPKYPLIATNAANMFNGSRVVGEVNVDTSACTNLHGMFTNAKKITSIGEIDTRKCTFVYNNQLTLSIFGYMDALESIKKVILKPEGTQVISNNCFSHDTNLKTIEFEGVIGHSLDLTYCKSLTKASVDNIIEHLSSNPTTNSLTFNIASEKYYTEDEWNTKRADTGWNIGFAQYPGQVV